VPDLYAADNAPHPPEVQTFRADNGRPQAVLHSRRVPSGVRVEARAAQMQQGRQGLSGLRYTVLLSAAMS